MEPGSHLRGQPAPLVVRRAHQLDLAGAEAAGRPVRVPRVHVALAAVPEVHGGAAVRAEHDDLARLGAQVGDGALGTALPQVARVDRVHAIASQVREVQHVGPGRPVRQRHVQHVPPPGAVVADRLGQRQHVAAVRLQVPHDHRVRGRV